MTVADASRLGLWEWVENIGWLCVILGCIGEGVAEFTKCPEDEVRRHKLGKVSWLILVAGLALEFWGSGRVSAIKDLEVARLNQKASEADERGKTLEVARAKLQKEVEALRRSNLELLEKMQPRTISEMQREKLISLMGTNPKSGSVQIEFQTVDGEAGAFAKQIDEVLRTAGFTTEFDPFGVIGFSSGGNPRGLFLIVKDLTNCAMRAVSIHNAFMKVGIPMIPAGNDGFGTNQVRVFVGTKPQ